MTPWSDDSIGLIALKASAFATCFALVAAFLSVLGD